MFWFSAIYVTVTMVIFALVPETELRVRERIRPLGIFLLAVGTFAVLLYIDKGRQ